MAPRPVCGDVIILQVGLNGEADLQIFHTRITVNYGIIQEARTLAPLWPSPHHQHTNGKESGGPRSKAWAESREERKLGRKGLSAPPPAPPSGPASGPVLSSFRRVHPHLLHMAPRPQTWPVHSNSHLAPAQLFLPHTL